MTKSIWTIGHSTRSLDAFFQMLHSFEIKALVDVRHYPGSRKFPHYNSDALETALAEAGITYVHIEDLGGRRRPHPQSRNHAWRHPAFRGYADHMESAPFKEGLKQLQEIAAIHRTAYMCSEAVWWRCHRALISDALKSIGWNVYHIATTTKATEHPYTSAANLVEGRLSYHGLNL